MKAEGKPALGRKRRRPRTTCRRTEKIRSVGIDWERAARLAQGNWLRLYVPPDIAGLTGGKLSFLSSVNMITDEIERFSFECRKVTGFALSTLRDWLKKFAPLYHSIRSKTKTDRDSLTRVFPRFASGSCNYFEF